MGSGRTPGPSTSNMLRMSSVADAAFGITARQRRSPAVSLWTWPPECRRRDLTGDERAVSQ